MLNPAWRRIASYLSLIGATACGSAARDGLPRGDERQATDATENESTRDTPADADDTASADELRAAAAVPVAGVSKLATLPNGDTLTIPIEHQLVQLTGIDSLVGELHDALGRRLCYYDIGPFSASVDATNGTREESVNQVFYYRQEPGSEGSPGVWQARFEERGPASIHCSLPMSRDEFLGLMRTYTATSPSPWEG